MQIAQSAGLDLVEVSPNTAPPVCKAMDYGRYLYQQRKEKKQPKAKAMKEIVLRPVIGEADYLRKLKNILEFLEKGHKVKVMVKLRGRERSTHDSIAVDIINRIAADVATETKVSESGVGKGAKERYKHFRIFEVKK